MREGGSVLMRAGAVEKRSVTVGRRSSAVSTIGRSAVQAGSPVTLGFSDANSPHRPGLLGWSRQDGLIAESSPANNDHRASLLSALVIETSTTSP